MRTHCLLLLAMLGCKGRLAQRELEAMPPSAAHAEVERTCRPSGRVIVIPHLNGVLEPCGCTVRSQGGVARLAAAVSALRRDSTPLLVLTVGNVFSSAEEARPGERKSRALREDALIAALAETGIDAVVLSDPDRQRHGSAARRLAQRTGALLIASTPLGNEERAATNTQVRKDGFLVRILAHGRCPTPDVHASSEPVVEILPSNADEEREPLCFALDAIQPHAEPHEPNVRSRYLRGGYDGHGFWLIETWTGDRPDCPETLARFVRLEEHAPREPKVQRLLAQVFARIGKEHTRESDSGKPLLGGAPYYVGSRTCAACHTQAYVWWTRSAHGRAYATLQRRGRELDLDCVGCHLTGFAEPGGARLSSIGELAHVGCESCHGPGSEHVDDPRPRQGAQPKAVADALCLGCHDAEHSDNFEPKLAREKLLSQSHGIRKRN